LKAGCRNSGPPLIHDLVAGQTPVGGESRPANAVSSDSATVQYQRSLMMTHALPRLSWPGLARSPTSFGRRRRGRDVDGRATPGHDGGIDESLSTSVGLSPAWQSTAEIARRQHHRQVQAFRRATDAILTINFYEVQRYHSG
jgi:hypothetical protein